MPETTSTNCGTPETKFEVDPNKLKPDKVPFKPFPEPSFKLLIPELFPPAIHDPFGKPALGFVGYTHMVIVLVVLPTISD